MADDELLSFSGELPDESFSNSLQDPALLNETTTSPAANITEMVATTVETILTSVVNNDNSQNYEPNPYRIGFLGLKCLLVLLVLTLTCTIRRDFLKFFAICLVVPLFIECGYDIFTEIHASTDVFMITPFTWSYLNLKQTADVMINGTAFISTWPRHAIDDYSKILEHYTTYQLYTHDKIFSIISFAFADFVFWTTLASTTAAFHYAHQAIARPDDIIYMPFGKTFLKMQSIPILMTFIDTLVSLYKIPYVDISIFPRIIACLLALTILTQIFASLFLFCRRSSEINKSSPYEQIRQSKMRLFLLIIFAVLAHLTSLPFIIWSALSLLIDFDVFFNFGWNSIEQWNNEPAIQHLFPTHLSLFLLRPFLLLILIIVFINPYRRRFAKFFCSCCRR